MPEGVQFVLHTLPVKEWCVGDGDGFTAFVDTADPREAAEVPQEAHDALSARSQARGHQSMDALPSIGIDGDRYNCRIIKGSDNSEILAREYRIRMRGIDAPELKMEYGKKSKIELVNLIKEKCLQIYVYGRDQYGRYVGDIYCDGVFIQEQMLKRGFAWHYKVYDKRTEFCQWEKEARAARRGLWRSDNPKKPWEWRRQHQNTDKQDSIQMDNASCQALLRMTKEKEDAEEKSRVWGKKWESVVAENRMLNDQLWEMKKCAAEKSCEWGKKWESVVAENRMLNDQLLEVKKHAEEKSREWRKEWESVVASNRMLSDHLWELKKELQKKEEFNQFIKKMVVGVGTSALIVGIVVLFRGPPPKRKGVAIIELIRVCKKLLK